MAGTHDGGITGDTLAWAAKDATGVLSPWKFTGASPSLFRRGWLCRATIARDSTLVKGRVVSSGASGGGDLHGDWCF
jgi:hypothetical protein